MHQDKFNSLLDFARDRGVDLEIYYDSGRSCSIKVFEQVVEKFQLSEPAGVGLRLIDGGRVGYSYSEKIESDALKHAFEEALANAQLSEVEKHKELVNIAFTPAELSTFNPELEKVSVSDKISVAMAIEKSAKDADARVKNVPYCTFSDGSGEVRVMNTKGVNLFHRSNVAYAMGMALLQDGEEIREGFDYIVSANFNELDGAQIGRKAVERGVAKFGAKDVPSGDYPVYFDNRTAATMLSTFASVFSAKNVQMGKSLMAGKLDKEVASPLVQIVDDALLADGHVSRPFDAEGYPSSTLPLVVDGVLKNYLYNVETANKEGVKSTGHAARGSFKSSVEIAPSNMFIKKGETTPENIIAGIKSGIKITDLQGLHSGCNPISGDFSLSAQGFFINDGKITHPVHNFTVSGNFIDMLKKVTRVGTDFEFMYPMGPSCFGTASLLIENLSVAGK